MNYGNGVLRRDVKWQPRSRNTSGPAFWAKAGLTAAYRFSGVQKKTSYQRLLSYRIDPEAPSAAGCSTSRIASRSASECRVADHRRGGRPQRGLSS
jgi:hypothetical protein